MPFDTDAFAQYLESIASAQQWRLGTADGALAQHLDAHDALAPMRDEYSLPTLFDVHQDGHLQGGDHDAGNSGNDSQGTAKRAHAPSSSPCLYLCGNSLGPMARRSKLYVEQELSAWGRKGVLGHFDHPYARPWVRCEERVSVLMSDIVGAKPSEVVAMGTLTANLHAMLATFYRPHADDFEMRAGTNAGASSSRSKRHKIIYEATAFPSDQYALASVVALAGFNPQTSLVGLKPRDGERTLRTEDVLDVLEREAATGELGLIMLGDVQYLTGQMFDVPTITKRARQLGIVVGWDLAHAFANVPLKLHDWDVDFAIWCTYKYGSSGPGGIAGLFVHERWGNLGFATNIGRDVPTDAEDHNDSAASAGAVGLPRPAGWWGHNKSTRFAMSDSFRAIRGASGWQQSNPSALDMAVLLGSLETLANAPRLLASLKPEEGQRANAQGRDIAPPPADFGTQEYAARLDKQDGVVGWGFVMPALRQKSQRLTAYLEHLLTVGARLPAEAGIAIVTPSEARFRGSQLSICLPDRKRGAKLAMKSAGNPREDGPVAKPDDDLHAQRTSNGGTNGVVPAPVAGDTFVARVHRRLERDYGLICDIRNPDMLRLAPVAQYSSFHEVWRAAQALQQAVLEELANEKA